MIWNPRAEAQSPTDRAALQLSRLKETLAWAVGHKDVDMVAGLLADDFEWISASTDSAGNPARDSTGGREWVLAALTSLLRGVPGQHAPSDVTLQIDQNLRTRDDSRPGKDPRFHQQVRTSIDVKVRDGDTMNTLEVTGNALFFITRGDSAAIPPDLVARGVKPDSTAWWFDRFEDETIAGAGLAGRAPRPAGTNLTLTLLLQIYFTRLLP